MGHSLDSASLGSWGPIPPKGSVWGVTGNGRHRREVVKMDLPLTDNPDVIADLALAQAVLVRQGTLC